MHSGIGSDPTTHGTMLVAHAMNTSTLKESLGVCVCVCVCVCACVHNYIYMHIFKQTP